MLLNPLNTVGIWQVVMAFELRKLPQLHRAASAP
jgi:hypothetical protein